MTRPESTEEKKRETPVADLVREAAGVVAALAFLPVDEEAERREEERCRSILPTPTYKGLPSALPKPRT